MTDNEIIKALECCTSKGGCINCPLYVPEPTGSCVKSVFVNALNLINRQKAEIERLEKHNTEYARKHYNDGVKEFAEKLKDNSFYCDVSFGYGKENCQEAVSMIVIERIVNEMVGE